MAEGQPAKKAKLDVKYELLYWPSMPGRGEFVRLALEASGVPYKDTANQEDNGIQKMLAVLKDTQSHAPVLCPPLLRVHGDDGPLIISQTPNILLYLGDHEPVAPATNDKYLVHQYALTALDLTNEAHNVHHPVAISQYYDDQKPEAVRAAAEFRGERIPKFFGYFDRALTYNKSSSGGDDRGYAYLVGDKVTYADTTVWQVVDGVSFAFPAKVKEMREKGECKELWAFYDGLKKEEWLSSYLESSRRMKYSDGIFRYYKELDV
ncbi:hypothetical protein Dda_6362 [Drechslerella dactyloides]|uniref:Glutathione S-transferase n=1 Tax=Drechslerella dactyloides TaxID=74499 RepID=A0AAD6NHG5_DREDA|nr:hypothetical protein Dda_6362 [Drechslerella dactyloides]